MCFTSMALLKLNVELEGLLLRKLGATPLQFAAYFSASKRLLVCECDVALERYCTGSCIIKFNFFLLNVYEVGGS